MSNSLDRFDAAMMSSPAKNHDIVTPQIAAKLSQSLTLDDWKNLSESLKSNHDGSGPWVESTSNGVFIHNDEWALNSNLNDKLGHAETLRSEGFGLLGLGSTVAAFAFKGVRTPVWCSNAWEVERFPLTMLAAAAIGIAGDYYLHKRASAVEANAYRDRNSWQQPLKVSS